MRIHGPHDPSQYRLHTTPEALPRGKKASSPDVSHGSDAQAAAEQRHVTAPELARLADQLRSASESREDLVKDAARRLADGDYGTRQTAERTADRILESPFGGVIRGI